MELKDKLRQILADKYGIKTDKDLLEAFENLDESALSIFAPRKEVAG